jgi:Ca2+-binding RTX toxin-like protein
VLQGNDADNWLDGAAGADTLVGGAGNDTLDGGEGADSLAGGAGDDVYLVDHVGSTITELAGEGTDEVRSSISYVLGANLENLTLTGTAALDGTGNTLNNVLRGNSGDNTLDGGAGADTLMGGAGNDIYLVDDSGNVVIELTGEGTDEVRSSVGYALPGNVEKLTLTGFAAVNGSGNGLDNVLTGNEAANTLNGAAGADTLIGGAGNDVFLVDNVGDVVIERPGEGTDEIRSNVSYSLPADVENLTLDLFSVDATVGIGNELNNSLIGSGYNNWLEGGAGADTLDGLTGADTLVGGAGDDIYVIDNVGDVVQEREGEGMDLVRSSVSYTLSRTVENLTLLGGADLTGNGNSLANTLRGNVYANLLAGWDGDDTLMGFEGSDSLNGGFGDDVLIVEKGGNQIEGGLGHDTFVLQQVANFENTVRDFSSGDVIELSDLASMTLLGAGNGAAVGLGQVQYQVNAGRTTLWVGMDNQPGADAVVYLDGFTNTGALRALGNQLSLPGNLSPTGAVTITGQATQGQTLTASNTLADADGIPVSGAGAVHYQWYADGAPIAAATGSTLLLTQAQVGQAITVVARYTDNGGTPESQGSVASALVANVNDAPTGSVKITGTLQQGQTLTASNTLADADGIPASGVGAISYQWKAGGNVINGATGGSLTLTAAEVGQPITVTASYTDGGGAPEHVSSAPTGAVGSGVALQGLAYDWKSHMLLDGVQVSAVEHAAVASGSDLVDLRNAHFDGATGVLSVQVWASPGASAGSLDFVATSQEAATLRFTSALTADWTVVTSTDEPRQLSLAAISLDGISSSTLVGTLEIEFPAGTTSAHIGLSGMAVGESLAADQILSLAYDSSGADGAYLFSSQSLGNYDIAASRTTGDSGSAISSADALAALRIAVGFNPNPDPDGTGPLVPLRVSPYQIMAADVNQDGKVTSADALAILRMAVNLGTALPREWMFVEETRDFWDETAQAFTLTRTAAVWDKALTTQVTQDTTVNLVGVLKGDVNGSWSAPAGSQDLDLLQPGYFQNLVALIGMPMDQWGA